MAAADTSRFAVANLVETSIEMAFVDFSLISDDCLFNSFAYSIAYSVHFI